MLKPPISAMRLRAAVAVIAILPSVLCQAQKDRPDLTQMSLEDLMKVKVETVYGASKHLQKVTQAPASITIITADDIRTYGYRTLADMLRSVPGFYVTYDRNYSYAAVRGFGRTGDYNSRILVLVDGHRMNDDIYDLVYIATEFPLDVDLIDRVEVIHGPSAAIYGNDAFFAVINVITKRGRDMRGLQLAVDGSSFKTGYSRATYGAKSNNWEALLSTSLYDSHGQNRLFFQEFANPATNNGIAVNADQEKFRQVFAKISYKELTLEVIYGPREKLVPTAPYGNVFGVPSVTTDRTGYGDLSFEHAFARGWTLVNHVYYSSYTYDGLYPFSGSPQTGNQIVVNHDYLNGAWWGDEVALSKPFFVKHLITFGSEFQDDFRQTQTNFDVEPFTLYLNNHNSSKIWAVFGQDEYSIRKDLLLDVGVRYDRSYSYGGSTNPRAALIYNPLRHTTLKLLYGTAFRAPNAYETYYASAIQARNTSLHPETIRTSEVVAEQYIGERCLLSGSVFENRIAGLIQQTTLANGLLQFQNVGAVRARGLEATFERKWAFGLDAQLNYTLERAVDERTTAALDNSPAHLLNGNVSMPVVPKKLTAGLDLHYVSGRKTLTGAVAPEYVVTNVTLFSQHLYKALDVSASVYNLLNTKYGYPGGFEHREDVIYQDGRNMRLKVTYTFGAEKRPSQ